MTGWNLPPGCTDRMIDEASPGYWDEPMTSAEEEAALLATANDRLLAIQDELIQALRPLAAAADQFDWVAEKGLDTEGVFLWATSNTKGEPAPKISVGDAFRARAALKKAEGHP